MTFKAKHFSELTTSELYEILKVRTEIFVVEQNCIYQDMDDKDYDSLHIFYEEGGKVLAYLRAFVKDKDTVQMGRVLTLNHGQGLGGKILHRGIEQIKEEFNQLQIYLEAQCYAIGYYAREGFEVCSGEIMVDGIPHVKMILKIQEGKLRRN